MAEQYWGPSELFTDNSPVYGTHPTVYVSIEPWGTSPEGVSGYGMNVDNGEVFDGHQRRLLATSGLAAYKRQTGTGDFSCWSVERQNVLDDTSVSLTPALLTIAGTPDNDSFKQFGVCSHVSGGTLTTPGANSSFEYYKDVSGYFLIEAKTSAARHRVFLLELNSGVVTAVTSENVSETDPLHAAGGAANYFDPTKLRLRVDTTGATALIDCYRTTNAGQEKVLFGGQIIRGTPLADGRCGFGFQTRRTNPNGHEAVGVANEFTIRDSSEATLYFNDRFMRAQPLLGQQLNDGDIGYSLASAWSGDGKTRWSSLIGTADHLVRGATANQIEVGNNLTGTVDWPGFHLWQNPLTTRAQHYAATIQRLNVDASTRTETGMLVRFSAIPFPDGSIDTRGRHISTGLVAGYLKTGYAVYVVHDSGASPVWQLEIKHFSGAGEASYEGDLLATADLGSFGLLVGTSYVLDVEIRNTDGTSFGQGTAVAIKVLIDSVAVTPVIEQIGGLLEEDDLLLDLRSAAQTDIGGVGLYFNPDALGSADLAAFLDFAPQALTDPPTTTPDEQATISIAAETASVSGTLTTPVDASVQESIITEPIVHRFESGKVQPIRTQMQNRVRYSVTATMDEAAWTALFDLYDANGSHTPMNWTHPYTGDALVVLFVEDALTYDARYIGLLSTTVYTTSFSLDLVFGQTTFNPGL